MDKCEKCGKTLLALSWSRLLVFEQCKAKSKLSRKHKNPTMDIRNFFGGTIADRAMRAWLLEDDPRPGFMAERIEEILVREEKKAIEDGDGVVRWKNKSDKGNTIAFCIELVNRLEPILYDKVIPYEYQPAHRFNYPVTIPHLDGTPTDILLVGEIDVLCRNDQGKFSLWDLKATKNDAYWKKTWGQLVFYDIAIQAGFDDYCENTGLIQPMCKERVLEFDITEDHRLDLMSRVIAMAHAYWRDDFAPKKTSEGCATCSVKHACPKWTPVGDVFARRTSVEEMSRIVKEIS
jgi:hypothetical protein